MRKLNFQNYLSGIMRNFLPSCIICFFLFSSPQFLLAQQENTEDADSSTSFKSTEQTLDSLANQMFTSFVPNGKMDAGMAFAKLLYKTLRQPGAFKYGFDSLGKRIHILYPEDKSFRIFNWLVAPDQNITRYYGIVQTADTVYPLINYSDRLVVSPTFLDRPLDRKHWFGAEYYKMITRKENGVNYYFLLGLNTDGTYSNQKILDVLSFTDSGIVFGAPLFDVPAEGNTIRTQYHVLWQYKKGAAFYLDYDQEHDCIAFDNLHSQINEPLKKNTYVPTGQVDGLKWERGKWVYKENIVTPLKLKDGQAPVNGVIQK